MHARKERIESFEKLSRERKIKRKSMSMEKKERKKKNLCVNERRKRKRKRCGSNKDMRGMDQVKEKKNKV
jgi:hypothetical protein